MPDQDDRVDAALARAVQQLESALTEQARAADRIRGIAERLLQTGVSERQRVLVCAIIAATAFQEVTGQRVKKVQRLVSYLRGQPDAHGLPKPSKGNGGGSDGLTPEEVARLLSGK
jgi:chemotaxis regulatin CheY-phosphate phosphatase CheZ